MGVTVNIKRPKFYEHFEVAPSTTRTCSVDDCNAAADKVQGYYIFENRRVRQWVCRSHQTGSPQLVLPTPPDLLAALAAEEEHFANMAKRYKQNVAPERGSSIKTLAPSGHGKSIPGDRVLQWRWGA